MRHAIRKKRPSITPAVAMQWLDIMPISRLDTTCTPRIMQKKRPSVTQKSTVPSKLYYSNEFYPVAGLYRTQNSF